tara:strand:+ start:16785 stop:17075 length:291 start_codon:yes stop_codon:yes gene_type:complete
MAFNPVNRHIWIELIKDEPKEDSSEILLPDEYKQKQSPYSTCRVLKSARDCELMLIQGDVIIVETSMILNLDCQGNTYPIILENYVYGSVFLPAEP